MEIFARMSGNQRSIYIGMSGCCRLVKLRLKARSTTEREIWSEKLIRFCMYFHKARIMVHRTVETKHKETEQQEWTKLEGLLAVRHYVDKFACFFRYSYRRNNSVVAHVFAYWQ